MKTLDEVIDELEDEGLFADALHYLKEYRDCGACAYADSYLRCTKEDRNEPLSWDELRQMRGQPVWIEDPGQKEWRIIDHVVDEDTKYERLYTQGFYPRTFYKHDHQWQAYRKERE